MAAGAVAGTKLYIGGTGTLVPSPDNVAWIEIGNISTLGAYGGTNFNKIALESVGSGFTKQLKGTQLAPSMDLVFNRDDADLGQLALKAASADRNSLFNFRVDENDVGTGANPTRCVFKGRVYGYATAGGGVNDLKRINTSIEVEPDTIITTQAA
jgi:hypothetical protein